METLVGIGLGVVRARHVVERVLDELEPGVLPELWRLPGEPVETLMARALSAMRTGGHHTTWFVREGDA